MRDVTFFRYCKCVQLRRLGRNAKDKHIMAANGVTLNFGNQQNGWKNESIFHEANGEEFMCAVKQLSKLIKLPIYLLYMYNKKQVLSWADNYFLSFFSVDDRATPIEAVIHSLLVSHSCFYAVRSRSHLTGSYHTSFG